MLKHDNQFSRYTMLSVCYLSLALAGCAGHGGKPVSLPQNKASQLSFDTFRIEYRPKSAGSALSAEDAVMFRAAQITIAQGMKYFAIVEIGDDEAVRAPSARGVAGSPGSVYGIFGVGAGNSQDGGARIAYARKAVTIHCFPSQPTDMVASNAEAVEQDIIKKYSVR